MTHAMRDGFNARFEDEVDPEHALPAEVRAKLAEGARKAYYASLGADAALEGEFHHD